jgi:hypothetical protein
MVTFWALLAMSMHGNCAPPDCELLMRQLAKECIAKGLKREAIVNNNIESVKMDLFHKYLKKSHQNPRQMRFKEFF